MSDPFPMALTIAGSDSSGGAGIQADLKTFTMLGVCGASALTAITAQNTVGVRQIQTLSPAMVRDQIDAVAADLPPAATKTGMLAHAGIIREVARAVVRQGLRPLVVDPVMIAKSGDALIDRDAVDALAAELLPMAVLVTPNRHEAARLLEAEHAPATLADAESAARRICDRFGCGACVVKGITEAGDRVDVLFDGAEVHHLRRPHLTHGGTHGSGCAYSAAITAHLAHGRALVDAVHQARTFIQQAIAKAPSRGQGTAPVEPLTYSRPEQRSGTAGSAPATGSRS